MYIVDSYSGVRPAAVTGKVGTRINMSGYHPTYQAHAMRSPCLRLNALLAAQIHVSPEETR
jgi:hypothetical protein